LSTIKHTINLKLLAVSDEKKERKECTQQTYSQKERLFFNQGEDSKEEEKGK